MTVIWRGSWVASLLLAAAVPVTAQSEGAVTDRVMQLIEAGQAGEAERQARAALDAVIKHDGRNSIAAADAHLPLAYALFATGRAAEAVALLGERVVMVEAAKGAQSAEAVKARVDHTSAMMSLAEQYEQAGNFIGAEPLLESIIANYARYRPESDRELLGYRNRLAIIIKDQGRPAEAEPIMRRTVELMEQHLGAEDLSTLTGLNNLGRIIEAQERHAEAFALYREARQRGIVGLGADHREVLVFGQNMGASLMYQNRLDEAVPVIRDTLERRRKVLGDDHPETIYSLSDLATALTFGNDPALAGPVWEETITRAQAVLGPDHPNTAMIRNGYALYLDRSGASPDAALAEARTSADAIRARRNAVGLDPRGQRSLANFTEVDSFYFELLLHTLRQSGNAQPDMNIARRVAMFNEALTTMQEAMENPANVAVIRRAAERAAATRGPGMARLASERQHLSDQWAQVAQARRDALAGREAAAGLNDLDAQQNRIESQIAAIDTRFEAEFPDFFALLRPAPVPAADLRALLKQTPDEAVLMVLPTDFGAHVIAISATDMDWHVSEFTQPMVDLAVRRLRWDLGASVNVSPQEEAEWLDEGEGAYPFDRTMAHVLYRQLIEPVEHVLKDKRHVYVVAGGSLSSLPFGVLVTEPPQGQDGNPADLRATSWLADKYALVQLPSLQSLAFLRRFGGSATTPTSGFLGFGDPQLDGQAQQRGGGKSVRGSRSGAMQIASAYQAAETGKAPTVDLARLKAMARLPGTARELEEIRQVLRAPSASIVMGAKATELAVKNTDLTHASVIAFATHGLLAGEIDGMSEPGLVFTPPAVATADNDGLLTMSEIAALRMNAEWVILSACNTAAGDGSQGATGLSGMARAFFLAGAQSLLASHWPVRDDVAAQLTVRAIAIGAQDHTLSRAEALQRAMREIRQDPAHDTSSDSWAHPNAWAPFTLIGDASQRSD